MNCPKCSHVQADGLAECERCGVIFAKIPPKVPLPGAAAKPCAGGAARPDDDVDVTDFREPRRPTGIALLAAGAALVLLALFLVNRAGGSTADGATQVNADKGYAYTPPGDWLALSPQNYEKLIAPYGDRFPPEVRQFVTRPRFDVSHVRIPEKESDFAPSINLIAIDLKGQRMPELTDREKAKATAVVTEQMKAILPTYRLQNSRVVKVDGLEALELSGTAVLRVIEKPSEPILGEPGPTGNVAILGKTEEVAREIELKSVQTFVPARRYGLLLSCNFLLADPHDTQATCRQVVNSFRITARPPRFDVVTLGAINGGLVGVLGFLLFAIARRIANR